MSRKRAPGCVCTHNFTCRACLDETVARNRIDAERAKHHDEAARVRSAEEDAQFAKQKAENNWPSDDCVSCGRLNYCCQNYNHHHLHVCLHCGNDERNPREWRFR